ncbi:hypothetical protein [Thermoflavifilum thermophilum]|nr:hypothetical protein [Thermoflavifilum thermophilum]
MADGNSDDGTVEEAHRAGAQRAAFAYAFVPSLVAPPSIDQWDTFTS